MHNKVSTVVQAVARIPEGATVMIGGFLTHGSPKALIEELIRVGTKRLNLICLDAGDCNTAIFYLFENKQVESVKVSYVGRNPHVARQMFDGTLAVELNPQGTLVERIRSGGAGLGGFLTPTGLGTAVAEGKQVINVSGKDYLLETALKADFALVRATTADEAGNLYFHGSTRNYNIAIATAAKHVIAEVENIVPVGALNPDHIHVSEIFVDEIVKGVPLRDEHRR